MPARVKLTLPGVAGRDPQRHIRIDWRLGCGVRRIAGGCMQIHINRDGQNFGPYSLDEVCQYVASGNIVLTDLAWYEGARGWMPLGQVPGVGPAARPAAAAVAAPAARPAPAYREPAASSDVAGERRPAGFWKRVLAALIDALVLIPVWVVIWVVSGGGSGLELVSNLLHPVIALLYFALMESSAGQATIGKRVVGIVVTDLSGDRIGFGRATGRYFGKILTSIILGIAFLVAAFTQRKQGLHDMAASTLVLNRSPEARDLPTWAIVLLLVLLIALPLILLLLAIWGIGISNTP